MALGKGTLYHPFYSIYMYIEKPIQKLKKKFNGKNRNNGQRRTCTNV